MRHKINKFHGGLTDQIFAAPDHFSAKLENLYIDPSLGLRTREGSDIYNSTNTQVGNSGRITTMLEIDDNLIIAAEDKLYWENGAAWTDITWNGINNIFYQHSGDGAGDNKPIDYAKWNNHIFITSPFYKFTPIKVFKQTSSYKALTAGLPEIPTTVVVTPDANDSKNYLYAFCFSYEYVVGTNIDFVDKGTVQYLTVTSGADLSGSGHYNQVSSLPNLANSSYLNYDTANLKVEIYRTKHNGSIFYYVGEVTNGTTTFEDDQTDTDISSNAILYTNGNVLDNDTPPLAKYITIANDVAWYGNIEGKPNRVRQAVQFDPDSCPESFYIDVDGVITGMGTRGTKPIVFTVDKCYRLDGFITEDGRGDIRAEIISDTVGCIGYRTIVQTSNGVYFAGNDGWYFTDGYKIKPISHQLNETYKDLINGDTRKANMIGTYDGDRRQVLWSCMSAADNDVIYRFQEDYGAWSTITGLNGFVPTALYVKDFNLIRGDEEGYIFYHDDNKHEDKRRDTSTTYSNWFDDAIVYNWKHVAFDFGDGTIEKYVDKVTVQIKDDTGQHIAVNSYNESEPQADNLKPIRSTGLLPWNGSTAQSGAAWGTSGIRWKYLQSISKTRRFPAGSLRTRYKQLELKSDRSPVDWSGQKVQATVDATAKTLTLASGSWSSDVAGWYIRMNSADGGTATEFPVVTRNSDTVITVTDDNGYLNDGLTDWEVIGYRTQDEVINIQAVTYSYIPLGDRGGYYNASESEGND